MAFWRRYKGRHALGAAVTSIPAAPRRPAPQPVAPTFAPPASPPVPGPPPAPPTAVQPLAAALDWSFPELAAPAPATVPDPVPPGPRVQLTFRDGSSASLDPTQARALDEIAQVLTRRD